MATYRRILQLVPEYPEAHCNLGHKLQELGQFSAAVESFRKGHEIGSKYPAWTYPSENWLEQSKRYAAIERVLADVVAGQAEADDNDQWILMAEACDVSRRPAAAARMYQKAFEADEDLASDIRRGLRYVAAECAARASMGRDNDLPQLNENERIQLHKQAIEWLRADLEVRKQQLQSGSPEVRKDVQGKLEHWRKDKDLAGIRETDLTPSQLELQKEFWKDVDALLGESPE